MQSKSILRCSDKPPTSYWRHLAFSKFARLLLIALFIISTASLSLLSTSAPALAQDGPILFDFEGVSSPPQVTEFTKSGLTMTIEAGPIPGGDAGSGGINEAWVFDSSAPTGGDEDLGTPNQGCPVGGPGVGDGGAPGTPGENCVSLGNVLIIAENATTPDDNANGGRLTFTFSESVFVNYFDLLDFEEDTVPSITFLDEAGVQLGTEINPTGYGDNSYERFNPETDAGVTTVVRSIVMDLPISGAIGGIEVIRAGSIGDTIFCDANGNSLPDAGEGIEGISVTLSNASGNLETVVTDPNGLYTFTDLQFGDYTITVDTAGLPPACNNLTVDPDDPADSTSDVSLTVDIPNDLDQDFGYSPDPTPLGSIGDTLTCIDDGSPLAGVTVTLTGNGITPLTATTSAAGTYLFENLALGPYNVTVNTATIPGTCNIPNTDPPSDTDGATDGSADVTLTDGEPDRLDQDFTFTSPPPPVGSIGDTLTCIDDGSPLAGVTVTLTGNGITPLTATTSPAGTYLFENLALGPYNVTVNTATIPGTCNIPNTDPPSDTDGATDGSADVTLTDVEPDRLDQDFTFTSPPTPLGSIGDTIFCDANGNGTPDPGEGISGVTVTITDANGATQTDTTDAAGIYGFTQLPLGTYVVTVNPADLPAACNVPSVDPDDNEPNSSTVVLTDTTPNNPNQDFGYVAPTVPLGSIGDTIFCDANGNGTPDSGEGLQGIGVTLTDGSGAITEATTGANGLYLFEGLPEGSYTVTVNTADLPATCNTPTVDPDDGVGGQSTLTLDAGENNLDQDFGYVAPTTPLGTIGDTIFCDNNNNGALDGGEGLPNISVSLSGPASGSDVTDANGLYLFDNLPAGDYTVVVDSTTLPTTCNLATIDPDGGSDNTSTLTLGAGEDNLDQDFGYQPTGCVGDRVWLDVNVNGIQDEGETGVSSSVNVIVTAIDDPTVVFGSVQTNANGDYQVCGLVAGEYAVRVVQGSLPDGIVQNFELDDTLNGNVTVNLGPGEIRDDVDFGYHTPVDLALRKTASVTATGPNQPFSFTIVVENESATLATGVEVTDQLPEGLTFTQSTANVGTYDSTTDIWTIGNLPGGETATLSISVVSTGDGPYTNVAEISDMDQPDVDSTPNNNVPEEDDQDQVTITGGAPSVAIGNFVWIDANGDGLQGANEIGLPGVTVTLLNSADAAVATTTTNAQGEYLFENLPPGSYSVSFAVPDGFGLTTPNAGDDGLDSDADPASNRTEPVTVTEGQNLTLDAGVIAVILNPELTVVKTAVQGQVIRGGVIIYEIEYANIGDGLAKDIVITEGIPPGTSFDAANSSAGWSCTGDVCTFQAGDLAAGTTGPTVRYAVIVDEDLPADVTRIDCVVSVSTPSTPGPGGQATSSTPVEIFVPTDVDPSEEPGELFFYFLPLLQ